MTTRLPKKQQPGVWLIYVRSESRPGKWHAVQRLRGRGWFCTCEDFTYRKLARRQLCKHVIFARHQRKQRQEGGRT